MSEGYRAAIFGHWGDRIGRKATLIATLLVTGLARVAVGLVPTYESIGIWGAVLLTVIRLIQGIGVGGEWGGSVLLAMEWARSNKTAQHRSSRDPPDPDPVSAIGDFSEVLAMRRVGG